MICPLVFTGGHGDQRSVAAGAISRSKPDSGAVYGAWLTIHCRDLVLTDVPLDMPVEELTTDAAERPSFEDRQIVRLRPLLVARPNHACILNARISYLFQNPLTAFSPVVRHPVRHLRASVLGVSYGMEFQSSGSRRLI